MLVLWDEVVEFDAVFEGGIDVEMEDSAGGRGGADTEVGVVLAAALVLVEDTFRDVLAGLSANSSPSIASWLPELTIERLCLPGASPSCEKSTSETGADFCGMPRVNPGVVFENAKGAPSSTVNVALVPSSPAHQPYTFTDVPVCGVSY